jgi:hypothetical protein
MFANSFGRTDMFISQKSISFDVPSSWKIKGLFNFTESKNTVKNKPITNNRLSFIKNIRVFFSGNKRIFKSIG